jgi:hypothetical protein
MKRKTFVDIDGDTLVIDVWLGGKQVDMAVVDINGHGCGAVSFDPKTARKIARRLLKAADYLESLEE